MSGFDEAERSAEVRAIEVDFAGHQRDGRIAAAFVGYLHRRVLPELKRVQQHLRTHLMDGTDTRGAVFELAAIFPDAFDQIAEGHERRVGAHHANVRIELEEPEERKVVPLVAEIGLQRWQSGL